MLLWKLCVLPAFLFVNVCCYDVLTNVFFENLKGHPLLAQGDVNEVSKNFIDVQIENYVGLVTGERQERKTKRSLLGTLIKSDKGIHLLSEVVPVASVPVRFPEDILLFQQTSRWYVVALESPEIKEKANYLVIFTYENGTFTEITRIAVTNGARLAAIDFQNTTLIAVAEYDSPKSDYHNKSVLYQYGSAGLVKIQSIDMHFAADVALWRIHDEIYMAFSQHMSISNGTHYEVEAPIYKWLGNHFDLVQTVPTKGAKRVTPFRIHNAFFLAVANFRDDRGSTQVYSEIYKYDFHEEKYLLYQRVLTKACTDIQVFSLGEKRKKDTFLVVANAFEQGSDGEKNHETDSIIYKFVGDYFIPFQSVRLHSVQQWLPVEGEQLVLFASSQYYGVRAFEYDGWSFQEVNVPGMKGKLRYSVFGNASLIVANKDNSGVGDNIFHLVFHHERNLHQVYTELMSWCDQGVKRVEDMTNSGLLDDLLGKVQRADIDAEDDQMGEIKAVEAKIDTLAPVLDRLSISPREIHADEVVFNRIAFVSELNTTKINDVHADDFLENVIDITSPIELEEVQIGSMQIENSLKVGSINGHDHSTLIHGSDDLILDRVTILGTLTVPEGVNINGSLNSVKNPQNLLRREGDQQFSRSLKATTVTVANMVAQSVNGEHLDTTPAKPTTITHMDSLSVKDLTVHGYINDVDVPTLEKFSLKRKGDQVITANFVMDRLQGRDLEVAGTISGRKLSHLVGTNNGSFIINQTMIFHNDLFVNDLKVLTSFDGILVNNGKLDVLLKDSPEEQDITGDKIFEDVVIYDGILLQGRINSRNLERMRPVVTINDSVFLEGDKTMTGQFEVEGVISANDVVASGGEYSLARLEERGVRLEAAQVQPHLYFVQQLNVDEVFVESINGRSVDNFVVLGSEDTQVIEGAKTFTGDVSITGATGAHSINSVNVEELESGVLKIEGEQTVVGKHQVKRVVAESVSSNETTFGDLVVDEGSGNVTKDGDFEGGVVKAEEIVVLGFLNGLPFDKIVNDTVTIDADRAITGHKRFNAVVTKFLSVENSIMDGEVPDQLKELRLGGPLTLHSTQIENLHFEDDCNGVGKNQFGTRGLEDGTVDGDHEFESIVVFGDTFVSSDRINQLRVTDLVENTVKIDEPHRFETVTFEAEVLSKAGVDLDGEVENLDFDNVVLATTPDITILDKKIFKNVTIEGRVNFEAFMNGLNISELCGFTMGELENKNLTIDGNAFFAKGPRVGNVNGANMKRIHDSAWFSDTDTTLGVSADFEDVIFRDDIQIEGFVDNISMSLLSENYFSKTRDQHVPATFTFENGLIFESNVTVPQVSLNGGLVNGVDLELFVRSALLDDYDQIFENVVFIETCVAENVTGRFYVNGLHLDEDVMRYDKVNMVTGAKTMKSLNVEALNLEKNIQIQGVDVLKWLKDSVLKTTDFNITGKKSFRSGDFRQGLGLEGNLNGRKFDVDNIMLKDVQQDVTGSKTLTTTPRNPATFKGLKLRGRLNEVDISNLINNQAYKNSENTFKTALVLHNNITTTNLAIKGMYQGVNVTELMHNVMNLGVLNNLLEEYQRLLEMSFELKESIRDQAYTLHHYKVVQTISGVTNSRKIECVDGVARIGVMVSEGPVSSLDLYGWYQDRFSINGTIRFGAHVDRVHQVFMREYLYTQNVDGSGSFIALTLGETVPFVSNLTVDTTSFVSPVSKEACTLFIYENSPATILCKADAIKIKQILPVKGLKATSITIDDTLYLIIISQPQTHAYSHTEIWASTGSDFHLHQVLFDARPQSVTTATHKGHHYLAVASGHLPNAMYSGRVQIHRFEESSSRFAPWQNLELEAPLQADLVVLPTKELVLYVLTDNPTEPLLVYRYEGIAGFQLKITGSALPQILYANQFVGAPGQHFIVAQSDDEINVIQAVFKGEKVD